jgi:hypothetical protein
VVPDEYAAPLADAMAAVGNVLESVEKESPDRQSELSEEADAAVRALTARVGTEETATDAPSAVESILMSLHRMLRVVKNSADRA